MCARTERDGTDYCNLFDAVMELFEAKDPQSKPEAADSTHTSRWHSTL